MFDFALDEVGTIRTLLHEELRPSQVVPFKTCRRRYVDSERDLREVPVVVRVAMTFKELTVGEERLPR